jgi:hypothetical protein
LTNGSASKRSKSLNSEGTPVNEQEKRGNDVTWNELDPPPLAFWVQHPFGQYMQAFDFAHV